jgi:hypothetical protein
MCGQRFGRILLVSHTVVVTRENAKDLKKFTEFAE